MYSLRANPDLNESCNIDYSNKNMSSQRRRDKWLSCYGWGRSEGGEGAWKGGINNSAVIGGGKSEGVKEVGTDSEAAKLVGLELTADVYDGVEEKVNAFLNKN